MRFGIVINMDYAHHPRGLLLDLFQRIRSAMETNGFRLDGRVFSITLPGNEASALARNVLEEIDSELILNESIYGYIKEFYGFDIGTVKNLLLPEEMSLTVEEYDTALVIEEIQLVSV